MEEWLGTTTGGEGPQRITAESADRGGRRFVASLLTRGIEPGARIAFQAPNSAVLLAAVRGALLGGFAPIMLSEKLTSRERSELLDDVKPALIVDSEALAASLAGAAEGEDSLRLGSHLRCRPMHFTSGTSGRPKGVWSGWLSEEDAESLVAEEQSAWGISAEDRYLLCAPMTHSAPLRFGLMTLAAGGEVVVLPGGFEPRAASRMIETAAVTTTFMAPAHLQRLFEHAKPAGHTMRLVAHAGSPCPSRVRQEARRFFGDDVLREFYGSTEGQFTICAPAEFDRHPGTVGRARPGRQLRIAGDGRIWCSVPEHARFEYWGDAAKTAQAWRHDADGDWFTVGDIGRLDEDGYLYLEGRRGDLIITGGVNVYPAEIERVMLELPGLTHVAAFGIPDTIWGERVCLAVAGDVTQEQVRAHCAEQLAAYKRPKSIFILETVPLTHSGKIDRLRLPAVLGL